jgi:hypothetical protein
VKKKLALLSAPIVLLAASAATAENRFGLTPYVGADAEFRHMDYHKDFGGNIINHDAPQGNVYAGVRLGEYFAVEGGYEKTKTKNKRSTLKSDDTLGGFVLPKNAGDVETFGFNTITQTKGLHANLVGFLPICDLYRLQLIGMVGFARLKTKTTLTWATLNGAVVAPLVGPGEDINIFKAKRSILRLGVGLQHMITCNWGLRGMLKWEASKKLKMDATSPVLDAGNPAALSIKPKNSVIYSIGAFYSF